MSENKGLVLVYTGTEVYVSRLSADLEQNGINSIVQDGFKSGLAAGFVGGTPSSINLFVSEKDAKKAIEIINAIVEK